MAMEKIPQVRCEKISQEHTLVSEAVSVLMCRAERRVPKEAAGEKATAGARMRAATASFILDSSLRESGGRNSEDGTSPLDVAHIRHHSLTFILWDSSL